MWKERVYNFAAGPSVLPESVLERASRELPNYMDSGMSVMEMSHRSGVFKDIFDQAKARLKKVLSVPDSHEILFLQGGATLQFAAIPMNLLENGSAAYAVTGHFSRKAAKEAEKYGKVDIVWDGGETGFDRIPTQRQLRTSPESKYFYYCANNTIYGTEWSYVPAVDAPMVCDMSSDILSKPVDVSRYSLIYAGAQKNMSPAGLTVVILDRSIAGKELPITPQVMSYSQQIKHDSMLNTPPCWCIYMLGLTLEWLETMGGVIGMEKLKSERAGLIYDCLDNSGFYSCHAQKDSRSHMNVTFRTPSKELDDEFVKDAAAQGLVNLAGHRLTGGIRASLYNAMPMEGAVALAKYMKDFEVKHHV